MAIRQNEEKYSNNQRNNAAQATHIVIPELNSALASRCVNTMLPVQFSLVLVPRLIHKFPHVFAREKFGLNIARFEGRYIGKKSRSFISAETNRLEFPRHDVGHRFWFLDESGTNIAPQ